MIPALIDALLADRRADVARVEAALRVALTEDLPPAQLAGLLVALRTAELTPELVAGAARAVLEQASPGPALDAGAAATRPLVDTCGTGGDGSQSFNVSTAAAFAVAACGAAVAKHGNRSQSSRSGSADVLEALGVPFEEGPEEAAARLGRCGFCFLFAPRYHPALARVGPVRRALGVRTIFNLLGPLLNPAGARRQLVGVYAPELTAVLAEALGRLGSERVLVVHCAGLDELGLHAPSRGHLLTGGEVSAFELDPRDVGLERAPVEALRVAGPEESARVLRGVLGGERGPALDATALNAGAALFAAGLASSVGEGVELARESLHSGAALGVLEEARR